MVKADRDNAVSSEPTPRLKPLTPQYDSDHHGDAVEMLRVALLDQSLDPRPRNIALAGAYGTGKSSVIAGLLDDLRTHQTGRWVKVLPRYGGRRLRTISISLPSLDSAGAETRATGENAGGSGDVDERPAPAELPVTNLIQKEIVKHLLYLKRPSKMRASRFRRSEKLGYPALLRTVLVVALGALILFLIDRPVWLTSHPWRFAFSAGAVAVLAVILQQRYAGRVQVDQLSAGGTTLSLRDSGSYFDEHLDEIVYYFQVSQCRLVIFEDIDRFDDAHIFEALRELNTLLNNAEQLQSRHGPIRFIYATRDSIFSSSTPDVTQAALNRTKFFDQIVSVVPFITHRTSAELLEKTMGDESGVSCGVLKIVAKYVSDMRLIYSICNDFAIFKPCVLGTHAPQGLTPDKLFAMAAYKNLHLEDFEDIARGTSNLDTVYRAYRTLVEDNAERLTGEIADIDRKLERRELTDEQCAEATRRLTQLLELVDGVTRQNRPTATIAVAGTTVDRSIIGTRAFWTDVLSNAGNVSITTSSSPVAVPKEQLDYMLGRPADLSGWTDEAATELESKRASLQSDHRALTRSGMSWVAARQDLHVSRDTDVDGPDKSLFEYAESVLDSPMAVELLQADYLDRNFVLYVGDYYGRHLTAEALNFVLRVIDTDTSDHHYTFEKPDRDVPAIIADAGHEFLRDDRGYNITVYNYLLTRGSEDDVDGAVASLARAGREDLEFLDIYLREGDHGDRLLRRLAPRWDGVFTHLARTDWGAEGHQLFSAALAGADPDRAYETSPDLVAMLRAETDRIPTLADDEQPGRSPGDVVTVVSQLGVTFPNIDQLAEDIRAQVIDQQCYDINATNLRRASHDASIALDTILAADERVGSYALDQLDTYCQVLDEDPDFRSVDDPEQFTKVLTRLADRTDIDDVTAILPVFLNHVVDGALIDDLHAVPPITWPALAQAARTRPTLLNLAAYTNELAGLESDVWTALLNDAAEITDSPDVDSPTRQTIAVNILGQPGVPGVHRVALVKSLDLDGSIPADEVPATELLPDLVAAGLVADTAEAFAAIADDDRATLVRYVDLAPAFPSYVDAIAPTEANAAAVAASTRDDVRAAALEYADLLTAAGSAAAASLARHAVDAGVPISFDSLLALAPHPTATDSVVDLLTARASTFTLDQVTSVLAAMPAPYCEVIPPGGSTGTVIVPRRARPLMDELQRLGLIERVRKKGESESVTPPRPS